MSGICHVLDGLLAGALHPGFTTGATVKSQEVLGVVFSAYPGINDPAVLVGPRFDIADDLSFSW